MIPYCTYNSDELNARAYGTDYFSEKGILEAQKRIRQRAADNENHAPGGDPSFLLVLPFVLPVVLLFGYGSVGLGMWLHQAAHAPTWLCWVAGFAGLVALGWAFSKWWLALPLGVASAAIGAYVVLLNFGATCALVALPVFLIGSWKTYQNFRIPAAG